MVIEKRDWGVQPLDKILNEKGVTNVQLVDKSPDQLTFKQVQKARSGRQLTPNIKNKIVEALNLLLKDGKYVSKQLFNY